MAATLGTIYQYKTSCWCFGQLGLNVLHYRVTAAPASPLSDAACLVWLDNIFAPLLIPMITQDAQYLGSSIQSIFPLPKLLEQVTTLNAAPGGDLFKAAPKQSALVVTKLSNFAGRANRGRVYLPFPSIGSLNIDGVPTAAYVALAQNYATQLVSQQFVTLTTTLTPIILQRKAPASSPVMTNTRVNSRFGTQRRRGDYGRLNPQTPA
jgi:hypothetical protein